MKTILLTLLLIITAHANPTWQPLWPGDAPGAPRPPAGSEKEDDRGHFTHVEVPQYALYQPKEPNGQCLIIIPGGGYWLVSAKNEGTQIAEWAVTQGITALIVKYRVGPPEFKYQFPVPLLDTRRAIRTARHRAAEWKLDPKQIGIIGFSAGGHLASCAATMFDQKFPAETTDQIDAQSCRPDFQILGYPVISMGTPHVHQGSQDNLLGKNLPPAQIAPFNTANRLTQNSPPLYFIHSADDKVVPLKNITDYAGRAAQLDIPVTGKIYPTGGHGFGQPGRAAAKDWTIDLAKWLTTLRP